MVELGQRLDNRLETKTQLLMAVLLLLLILILLCETSLTQVTYYLLIIYIIINAFIQTASVSMYHRDTFY